MKAIVFDLDNTLTDRTETIRRYSQVFLCEFKHALLDSNTEEAIAELLIRQDEQGYGGHEERSRKIAEAPIWNDRIDVPTLANHWKSWIPYNPQPMDGMKEVLEELQTWPVKFGLVTNGSSTAQRTKIEKLGIGNFFDAIIVSEEVGFAKPDQRIFEVLCSRLALDAEDCIFIGDDPTNDYMGSQRYGMTPVWFSGRRPWLLDTGPTLQVASLAALPKLLKALLNQPGQSE